MNIVISQSMYFPWVGFLEQIKLADTYVHLNDVQFSKGSFTNRVQIKTQSGISWLTLPTRNRRLGQKIDEVLIDQSSNWQRKHRYKLEQAYANTPFFKDVLMLFEEVCDARLNTIEEVSRKSLMVLVHYFSLDDQTIFKDSRDLNALGAGSERVLNIVQELNGSVYITGHGAFNYLDHSAFENAGIEVKYMQYERVPYPQLYGEFTPYVSSLDLVANCGRAGVCNIVSAAKSWKEFRNE